MADRKENKEKKTTRSRLGLEKDPYKLIDHFCTVDQIKAILRAFKPDHKDEIFLSGNKPDLIENLRKVVKSKVIPFNKVVDAIREAEENGNQHIFYLEPRKESVRKKCRDGMAVATELWGEEFDEGFPRFDVVPETYAWADFRQGLKGRPRDWIAKAYGHYTHLEQIGTEPRADGTIAKIFKPVDERVVCCARWNDHGFLELRIESAPSKAKMDERIRETWKLLAPALKPTDFVAYDFSHARRRLLEERQENEAMYRLNGTQLTDSSMGSAQITPHTEDESVDGAPEREATIACYLESSDNGCRHLLVTWLPGESNKALDDDLRTISGGANTNELIIQSRVSSRAVDYVTNRFLEFNR